MAKQTITVGSTTGQKAKDILDNNFDELYLEKYLSTTATAASTTTLTVSSNRIQEFTGSTTQTIVMPVVTTFAVLGETFKIINNSTGQLTVNSSGSDLITTIDAGITKIITCVKLTGTDETSWTVNDFGGGGTGNMTNSTGNTFTPAIVFDVDRKYFDSYAQSGDLAISLDSNTNGTGSYAYAIIATDDSAITFPAGWIGLKNEYLSDSANYILEILYDGYDYLYWLTRKANEIEVEIINAVMSYNNDYIEFDVNYPCYADTGLSNPLVLADFTVTFAQNGGVATAWTASSITNDEGGALAGGEMSFRIYGSATGTPDGNETITVTPANATSVVGSVGGTPYYMDAAETTGAKNLVYISQTLIGAWDISVKDNLTLVSGDTSQVDDISSSGNDASQGTAARRPTYNENYDSIILTKTGQEYLNIGDIAAYEFQDDDNFSVMVEIASSVESGDASYVIANRTLDSGTKEGWTIVIASGVLYFTIKDSTTAKNTTDSINISDSIFRKYIFTHNSSGETYMYDEDNNLIASNTDSLLGSIDYTGLETNIGVTHKNETAADRFGDSQFGQCKIWSGVLTSADRIAAFKL